MIRKPHIITALALAYLLGTLLVLNLNKLPAANTELILLLFCAVILIAIIRKWLQVLVLLLLLTVLIAACHALYKARDIRSNQLADSAILQTVSVDGWVSSLPLLRQAEYSNSDRQGTDAQFLFTPLTPVALGLPDTLKLSWYRTAPQLAAGDFLRLKIRLKPPRGRLNFIGFDFERWLFRQQIGALGSVSSGQLLPAQKLPLVSAIKHYALKARYQLATDMEAANNSTSSNAKALIRALAIADRSNIGTELKDLFARTGTAHLLAISGLHIGLVASFGFILGNLIFPVFSRLWPQLSQRLGKRRLALLPGMAFAFSYASLAGWSLPTQRAVIMLSVIAIGLSLRRKIKPWAGWSLALLLVLIFDPMSPLDAGFWLSFAAVAWLILMLSGRQSIRKPWQSMLRAQWVVVLALMPLTILLFSRIPLASLLSNLVAIPLTGFLLVPAIMIAIGLIAIAPTLSTLILTKVAWLVDTLVSFLGRLDQLIPAVEVQLGEPTAYALPIISSLAILLLLLPRPMPLRYLALPWLLPMLLPLQSSASIALRLEMLDVGQGLAVLLETPSELLLYDSGPGDGRGRDMVASVLLPAIKNTNKPLTTVIISHGDMDHAGGLFSLRKLYPQARYFLNRPSNDYARPCTNRETINWPKEGGLNLQVLHPNPELPYLGNDSSCVLALELAGQSILLSGDIGQTIEQRILRLYPDLRADNLLIPHHGSRSSSAAEFIKQLNPELGLLSTGYANRFKLPAGEVVNRYLKQGSKVLDTSRCGAIRLDFDGLGGAPDVSAARLKRQAIWRMTDNECW